jgi:5-formyltetrahydrofolate cyclo-ligase
MGSELQLLEHCPMEHCWLPHALPDGSLQWFAWQNDIAHWPQDSRSLPQPPTTASLNTTLPQTASPCLVITPCLAADRTGTRLGYGGGYYDRFLATHRKNVLTVACVASDLFFPENVLPKESHDVSVDVVVTEKETLVVSKKNFEAFQKKTLSAVNC